MRNKILFIISIQLLLITNIGLSQKISLEKDLQIESQEVGYIHDLGIDQYGNIFVSDIIGGDIKQFLPTGTLEKKIGKKGRGPGELQIPRSFSIIGNTLYIFDNQLLRISVFDVRNETEILDTITLKKTHHGTPDQLIALDSTRFLGVYSTAYSNRNLNEKKEVVVALLNGEGNIIQDFIMVKPAKEYLVSSRGQSFGVGPKPFGKQPIFQIDDSRQSFYYGDTNKLEIFKYSLDKDSIKKIVHKNVKREAVNKNDLIVESKKLGYNSREIDSIINKLDGSNFPVYDWFVIDDKSRIWVAVNTKDRQHYSLRIYDQEGDLVDQTTLPKSVELKEVSDGYTYGIREDEEGVQSVVRYKVNSNS
ncbi:hypothetical protein [Fodinibius salsisoli]|uniref:6-bladed beta-propeller protein n=1 Tax=Fodinibius salsisoli TaxID=2820877 RepID=A0ABT3PQU4_9BACT|nr:hypothetical protein [Fodinibius salsisoli]MCW9708201.1 hypothetical protein [Fodinibius salsisoli]